MSSLYLQMVYCELCISITLRVYLDISQTLPIIGSWSKQKIVPRVYFAHGLDKILLVSMIACQSLSMSLFCVINFFTRHSLDYHESKTTASIFVLDHEAMANPNTLFSKGCCSFIFTLVRVPGVNFGFCLHDGTHP